MTDRTEVFPPPCRAHSTLSFRVEERERGGFLIPGDLVADRRINTTRASLDDGHGNRNVKKALFHGGIVFPCSALCLAMSGPTCIPCEEGLQLVRFIAAYWCLGPRESSLPSIFRGQTLTLVNLPFAV